MTRPEGRFDATDHKFVEPFRPKLVEAGPWTPTRIAHREENRVARSELAVVALLVTPSPHPRRQRVAQVGHRGLADIDDPEIGRLPFALVHERGEVLADVVADTKEISLLDSARCGKWTATTLPVREVDLREWMGRSSSWYSTSAEYPSTSQASPESSSGRRCSRPSLTAIPAARM